MKQETFDKLCENCGKKNAKRQRCNGDNKWHWHGGVHRRDINGHRGGLQDLCNDCIKIDAKEWELPLEKK